MTTTFGAFEEPPGVTPYLHLVAVETDDTSARVWRYLSTITSPDDVDFEQNGPGESSLTLLSDGSILCGFRVDGYGSKLDRCVSTDGGCTWSTPERIETGPFGVIFSICRLADETLVIRGGRPVRTPLG